MTERPVRISLVGGSPLADAYAAAIVQAPGFELVSAASQAAPTVDGAICTSRQAAREAIRRGNPVLLDAGATDTSEDLDQVQAVAHEASVALVVAHPWRFHEVARSFRAAVDAGELGPPAFFHWVEEGSTAWTADGQGEGAGIDLALWLLGDQPSRVYARRTGAGGRTVSIRFQNGANALVEWRAMAANDAGYGFAWLLGPRGEVRWDQRADGLTVNSGGACSPSPDVAACLRAQVAHALACWTGVSDAMPSVAAARSVARTIAAANESARLGQPVAIAADEEGGA